MKKSGMGSRVAPTVFDATSYKPSGLNKTEAGLLKDAFDLIDTSGAGKIDSSGNIFVS